MRIVIGAVLCMVIILFVIQDVYLSITEGYHFASFVSGALGVIGILCSLVWFKKIHPKS